MSAPKDTPREVTADDCARIAARAARNAGEDYSQYPLERQFRARRGIMQCVQAMLAEGWILVSPSYGELRGGRKD